DGDAVTNLSAQHPGQLLPEDDAEITGLEVGQPAVLDLPGDLRDRGLAGRVDAADDGSGDLLSLQHRFTFDVRRGTEHAAVAPGYFQRRLPLVLAQPAADAGDGGV